MMISVFYVPFNIIFVISRRWKSENERKALCNELNSASSGIRARALEIRSQKR